MPISKSNNVTLKDVAKRVGVSAMTVSRALSGKKHLVNADTIKKCRDAAHELGYVPNLMARSLRGEQLRTVVMMAEHISAHHYLAELVDTVSRTIEEREYGVISCQSIASFRQALRNFKLAGAVVIAPPEQLYEQMDGDRTGRRNEPQDPTVVIHSAVRQCAFNEVSPDIEGLAYTAARHLIELGHRQLAYLGGPRQDHEPLWFGLRRAGSEKALAEAGINANHLHHQPCPEAQLAPAALQQLLGRSPETTGIICINDEVAIATIAGADKMGLAVPKDLSVVGCNDITLAQFYRPALTTLAIDIRSMVETALNLLFDDIKQSHGHNSAEVVRIALPANLIVRESTGPPRQD